MFFDKKILDIYQDPKVSKVKVRLTGAWTEGPFYKGGNSLEMVQSEQILQKEKKG